MTALDDLCNVPFHDADAPRRARILSRLVDTELSVALSGDADGDLARFRIFDLPGGPVAMAFDAEDRLSGFFGGVTSYVAMPGRVLATSLRQAQTGLLVNPGHPSEMLLDAATLGWLETALSATPMVELAQMALTAPKPSVVAMLAEPLAERLTDLRGMIGGAALVGTAVGGHLLVIAGAPTERRRAIAKALSETLAFLPEIEGGIDITFSDVPLPRTALRFDLAPPPFSALAPKGPPILR